MPRNAAAITVWVVLAAGFGFGFLPRTRVPHRLVVALGILLALAAWSALSLLWSDSAERTYGEITRIGHYLALLTAVACLLDRHTWTAAAAGLATAGVATTAIALTSRLTPDLVGEDLVREGLGTTRLGYPLNYWNALGAWGAMTMAMVLAWSAHAETRIMRAAALATTPSIGLTIYLTGSRAAVLGLLVGAVVIIAASQNRFTAASHMLAAALGASLAILVAAGEPAIADGTGAGGAVVVLLSIAVGAALCAASVGLTSAIRLDRRRMTSAMARPLVALGVGVVVAALAAAVFTGAADRAWESFTQDDIAASESNQITRLSSLGGDRAQVWTAALHAFEDEPVTGLGAGTFGSAGPRTPPVAKPCSTPIRSRSSSLRSWESPACC